MSSSNNIRLESHISGTPDGNGYFRDMSDFKGRHQESQGNLQGSVSQNFAGHLRHFTKQTQSPLNIM